MKTKQNQANHWIQVAILAALGLAAVLSLILPQLLQRRREPQLLSLSVMLRDTDSSGWSVARQGMEQAADELGAELRFLTLTAANDSAEQEALLLREIDGGAAALVVVPADPAALSAALNSWLVVCPAVTLESPMEGAAGGVSPDNALLGRQLAEALLEDWDGGGVVLLDTAQSRGGVADRLAAAEETLAGAGVPVARKRRRRAGISPCTAWGPPRPSPPSWSGEASPPLPPGAIMPRASWRCAGRWTPSGEGRGP